MTEPAARLDRPVASGHLSSGMARKVDDLGRIVLPVEMRRMFGIKTGDELHIAVIGGDILLRKVEDRCVFCEATEGLRPYRTKQVCAPCARALAGTRALGAADAEGDLVHPPLGDVELGGHSR
ncbi:MAG: AbrB/MazE/SpoVT family DNA-binding domain-containing protein [Actinomycetota bacterium]|nr:AbrB/MazE/SpoVT family DNA-binding domain-containing protein [Actinomycetota bacterium]